MSSVTPWVTTAVLVLLLLLLVAYRFKKEKRETDYRFLFRIGVMWLAIGLAYPFVLRRPFELSALIILGLIFTIAGLANKSKWDKPRRALTEREEKIQNTIIKALVGLIILGAVVFLYVS